MRTINILIIFILFLVWGCSQNIERDMNVVKMQSADSIGLNTLELANDSINRFQFSFHINDSIKVKHYQDTIYVTFNSTPKTIKIQYTAPVDIIVPCNCLAVKKNNAEFSFTNYYVYKDSILLLPVMDLSNRINLFVININNGKLLYCYKPRESYMLSTYLTWFIFNEKNGTIITSNSIDLEGKTVIHYFKIYQSEIGYVKSVNKVTNLEVYDDEKKMKNFIKQISK